MILIAIFLFLTFLIWTFLLFQGKLTILDNNYYEQIKINNSKTSIFKAITLLADARFIIFISLILYFMVELSSFLVIVINMLLTWSITCLLKRIFKRPRPKKRPLVTEKGYSYPSGHTMIATTFYGFIIFMMVISDFLLIWKILLTSLFVILIFLIGYTRVYLGVHFFSDVLGGILLGSSYLLIYIYFTDFFLSFICLS